MWFLFKIQEIKDFYEILYLSKNHDMYQGCKSHWNNKEWQMLLDQHFRLLEQRRLDLISKYPYFIKLRFKDYQKFHIWNHFKNMKQKFYPLISYYFREYKNKKNSAEYNRYLFDLQINEANYIKKVRCDFSKYLESGFLFNPYDIIPFSLKIHPEYYKGFYPELYTKLYA